MVNRISDLLGVNTIKGDGFDTATDTLEEIRDELDVVRADTGELNSSAIIDGVITGDTTLTGDTVYNNLTILSNANLDCGDKNILVQGDLVIYSARLTNCASLEVYGTITIQRAVGDTSYTNIFDSTIVYCHGNAVIKNAEWDFVQGIHESNFDDYSHKYESDLTLIDVYYGMDSGSDRHRTDAYGLIINVKGNFSMTAPSAQDSFNWGFHNSSGSAYGVGVTYLGYSFILRCDGNVTLAGSSITAWESNGQDNTTGGGAGGVNGGRGGDFLISAGGTLTVPSNFQVNLRGGDTTTNHSSSYAGDGGDFTVNHVGSLTGSFATPVVAGGVGTGSSNNGSSGTNNGVTNSQGSDHIPQQPDPTTADGATSVSSLVWDIPVDINSSTLDFQIQIQEKFTELVYIGIYDHNTNDDAASFSGTPPYTEGTGSVTYTLSGLTTDNIYRWRVRAMKNSDTDLSSLWTAWRSFTAA